MPSFGPEYKIEISIKIRSWGNVWQNIFRFTGKDGDCCEIGSRSPALFIHGPSDTVYLISNIGSNGNKVLGSLGKFETDEWFSLTIHQKKDKVYVIDIVIDNYWLPHLEQ